MDINLLTDSKRWADYHACKDILHPAYGYGLNYAMTHKQGVIWFVKNQSLGYVPFTDIANKIMDKDWIYDNPSDDEIYEALEISGYGLLRHVKSWIRFGTEHELLMVMSQISTDWITADYDW